VGLLGAAILRRSSARVGAARRTTRISIVKMRVDANWAQVLEGAIDSAHSSTLHATDMPPARVDGAQGDGHRVAAPLDGQGAAPCRAADRLRLPLLPPIRRPIKDAETHVYMRVTLFVAPFTVLIPPNNVYNLSILNVPVDDTHTMFYFIAWSDREGGGIDQEAWRKFCGAQPGVDLDRNYRHRRNRDNGYLQDRQAMRLGDFTGMRGIPTQDMADVGNDGAIADRSSERLGASDLAIVEFRRRMVDAVRRHGAGEPAIGTAGSRPPYATLQSFEGIVAKGRRLEDAPERHERRRSARAGARVMRPPGPPEPGDAAKQRSPTEEPP
jgi:phthalate 4,5-dioxygenase oxygenase subunit